MARGVWESPPSKKNTRIKIMICGATGVSEMFTVIFEIWIQAIHYLFWFYQLGNMFSRELSWWLDRNTPFQRSKGGAWGGQRRFVKNPGQKHLIDKKKPTDGKGGSGGSPREKPPEARGVRGESPRYSFTQILLLTNFLRDFFSGYGSWQEWLLCTSGIRDRLNIKKTGFRSRVEFR